jgi:hypothetical protein
MTGFTTRERRVDRQYVMREMMTALAICGLLAACAKGDERVATTTSASSSVTSVPGAVVVARDTPSVSSDTEDADDGTLIFNRQWDPGRTDEAQPHTRFLAREYLVRNRSIVLSLDTAITPVGKPDAFTVYASADSILVSAVGRDELFTEHCHVTGSEVVGQIGGVSSRGTPERFEHPRLAWRFDTVAKRIQPMDADSVYCTISEPD